MKERKLREKLERRNVNNRPDTSEDKGKKPGESTKIALEYDIASTFCTSYTTSAGKE